LPDAESFYHSRQQFQIILTRMELLIEDLEVDPKPSSDTVKKYLEALLASMNEYAKFLRDLQRKETVSPRSAISPEV
jgi:hypothetical protein